MSPARKNPHRPPVHAKYLAELRGRVDALGFRVVAKSARMGLATLWRTVGADVKHPPTLDAVERVRVTVTRLEPAGAEIPPPIVSVQGAAHAAWCAIGAELAKANPSALAAAVASPRTLRAAVVAAARPAARRTRRRRT